MQLKNKEREIIMKGIKNLKKRFLSALLAATMVVTGLSPASAVKVQAEESNNVSQISEITELGIPEDLKAVRISDSEVVVSWDPIV